MSVTPESHFDGMNIHNMTKILENIHVEISVLKTKKEWSKGFSFVWRVFEPFSNMLFAYFILILYSVTESTKRNEC